MTQAKRKRLPSDLTREDWVKAGFVALTKNGPSGVKIDQIAKFLKITRGSFYWHFESAKALRLAMMDHWVQVGTNDVIALTEGPTKTPLDKFAVLGQRISGPRDLEYGGILAESAIRDWGRYDADVGKAVLTVTRKRLAYIASLFEDLGFEPSDSNVRANLLYSSMIGLEFLNSIDLATLDTELATLMQMFIRSSPSITKKKGRNI